MSSGVWERARTIDIYIIKWILSDNRHTTGWDADLNRRLAVPIAISALGGACENRILFRRRLKEDDQDPIGAHLLTRLADNREHLEALQRELEGWGPSLDTTDVESELDYLRATIQLGLLEVAGELEEIPTSEEILEEAFA